MLKNDNRNMKTTLQTTLNIELKQKGFPTEKLETLDFYGGPSGDRTRDLLIKSQLLYQLS